jgi:tRNA (mo5U34)-methyltransferase
VPEQTWTPEQLRAEVASRTWFHTIDLGRGIRTPGEKDTNAEVDHMHLPDLTGRTVLDIGAYDGYYSFVAEQRGASRVLATDSWTWNWPGADARRNFELAHEVLGSRVESQVISVEDLRPETVGGTFDVVLFLGVLYHAPDPIGYLRRVRDVTAGVAIVETLVDLLDIPVPAAAYYPGGTLNHDASNQFGPNALAVTAWLMEAGFSRVVEFEPWHTNPVWAVAGPPPPPVPLHGIPRIVRGVKHRLPKRRRKRIARSGRMVFHAYV